MQHFLSWHHPEWMGLLRMSQSCGCNDLELCPSLLKCYRRHHTDGKTLNSQENQMTGFIEKPISVQLCIYIYVIFIDKHQDNWLHLMSKILGGPCLLSGRLSFSLLKSKAKKYLRKTCKEYEKKSICPSLVGQWAWVWSWETPRACRTPYIPLLMSPCRQALSPSGTRLTSSLTAAACLHNPNQEVLENKNFLYTSGIIRGHWTEQKLQYEEKQINCLKKDIYIDTQLFILPSLSIGPVEITPWPSCSRKPCPAHFGDNGANVWGGGGV